MHFEYRTGCMAAYSYAETYLIRNGYEEVATELQDFKPIIVYDYLNKNGYHEVAKQFAEAILEKDKTKTQKKRKLDQQVKPSPKKAKVEEIQSIPKKPKEGQEPRQFEDDELNRLVTIKDVFSDKVAQVEKLQLEFPGTELAKVAKFILDDNVNVKNSIALTIFATRSNPFSKKHFPFLKTSKLSGISYGDNSEESLLMKNWDKLVEKVPIFIQEKFVTDIMKTSTTSHVWIQKLLGAYLSQGFVHHRCSYQFYTKLIGLKMRKGSFDEEEKEKLLEFDKKHSGKPTAKDWKQLALEMDRLSHHLQNQLKYLKESKDVSQTLKKSWYTLEDEFKILSYLNENFEIGNSDELKSLSNKDFKPLVKVLQRGEFSIYNHYHGILLPILLGNLYGTLNMHWEDEFFKSYIIDQKVESISDVNWDFVLKEKPFLTRKQISVVLNHARRDEVEGPLYEQIAAFRSRIPTGRSSPKWIEERKRKINQIYDDMRKAKAE